MPAERVYIGLGSNVGDRTAHLAHARARLNALPGTRVVATSRVEETAPLGPVAQGPYLNQMVLIETSLPPEELARMGFDLTGMGWPVAPDALRELLVRVQSSYGPPAIYVTENGAAFMDQVEDGVVHDPRRVSYLAGHVDAVASAMAEGAMIRGYFVWSLLDNFEWAHGYSKRFGLTYVDYTTQQRIVKDSGRWYARLASGA